MESCWGTNGQDKDHQGERDHDKNASNRKGTTQTKKSISSRGENQKITYQRPQLRASGGEMKKCGAQKKDVDARKKKTQPSEGGTQNTCPERVERKRVQAIKPTSKIHPLAPRKCDAIKKTSKRKRASSRINTRGASGENSDVGHGERWPGEKEQRGGSVNCYRLWTTEKTSQLLGGRGEKKGKGGELEGEMLVKGGISHKAAAGIGERGGFKRHGPEGGTAVKQQHVG